ncbi:MAG TPA: hypothetical protein PKD96_00370 [Candidatus Absconditabacterales bacterium]|nr:hypothetical protein [Candidatus Absconditabacterales bacterium]
MEYTVDNQGTALKYNIPNSYLGTIDNMKKTLKGADLTDRYRDAKRDINQAIAGILDRKKSEVRGINRGELPKIMEKILKNPQYFSILQKMQAGALSGHDLKDTFNQDHIDMKRRKKVAKLLNEVKNDPNWERIIDINNHKGLDYTAAYNTEQMLNLVLREDYQGNNETARYAINENNVLLFLCDYDSNGFVNSSNESKGEKGLKKKRDTAAIMGEQLYANFFEFGSKKQDPETGDREMIDGPETSRLLHNILVGVQTSSTNPILRKNINLAIDSFKGKIMTRKDFLMILRANPDIKDHIKNKASFMNEFVKDNGVTGRAKVDASDLFGRDRMESNAKADAYQKDWLFQDNSKEMEKLFQQIPPEQYKLFAKMSESESLAVRKSITARFMQITNFLIDTVYMKFGPEHDELLADLFEKGEFGVANKNLLNNLKGGTKIQDYTKDPKNKKTVLANFIRESLQPGLGIAFDKSGKPILGVGVNYEKLSKDLGDKFKTGANFSFNFGQGELYAGVDVGGALQVNREELTRLNNIGAIPVKRFGAEAGAFASTKEKRDVYIGAFYERDLAAGIEQQAQNLDTLAVALFGVREGDDFLYDGKMTKESVKGFLLSNIEKYKTMISGNGRNEKRKNNWLFDGRSQSEINTMISDITNSMESEHVFDNPQFVNASPAGKGLILRNIMAMYRAGLIEQYRENQYERLGHGGPKLTKLGVRFSLKELIRGNFSSLLTVKFSSFSNRYVADIDKEILIMNDINTGGSLKSVPWEKKETQNTTEGIAEKLSSQLAINGLIVKANPDGKTVNLEMKNGQALNSVLNMRYTKESQNGFSYDGNKLTLGNVGDINISKKFERGQYRVYLTLGDISSQEKTPELLGIAGETGSKTPENLDSILQAKQKNVSLSEMLGKENFSAEAKNDISKIISPDGKLQNSGENYRFDDIASSMIGKKFKEGRLSIQKQADGTVDIRYIAEPKGKFTLQYEKFGQSTEKKVTLAKIKTEILAKFPDNIFGKKAKEYVSSQLVEKDGKVYYKKGDTELLLPQNGELVFTEMKNGTVSVEHSSTESTKLAIVYQKEGATRKSENSTTENLGNIEFQPTDKELEAMLKGIENSHYDELYSLTRNSNSKSETIGSTKNTTHFSEFIRKASVYHAADTTKDQLVGGFEYKAALWHMSKILEPQKNGWANELYAQCTNPNLDEKQLAYLVNRLKSITAVSKFTVDKFGSLDYRAKKANEYLDALKRPDLKTIAEKLVKNFTVEDWAKHQKTFFDIAKQSGSRELYHLLRPLSSMFNMRINGYNEILGREPGDMTNLFKEYRTTLHNTVKDKNTWKQESVNDIMGFTAYYRAANDEGKRFSFTQPGPVKIVEGSEITIGTKDQDSFKKWFLQKIENNVVDRQMAIDAVKQKLGDKIKLDDNQIKNLLENGEFKTTDGKTVKLNRTMVGYLAGECANESFGMKVESITIETSSSEGGDSDSVSGSLESGSGRPLYEASNTLENPVSARLSLGGSLNKAVHNSDYDIRTKQHDLNVQTKVNASFKKTPKDKVRQPPIIGQTNNTGGGSETQQPTGNPGNDTGGGTGEGGSGIGSQGGGR